MKINNIETQLKILDKYDEDTRNFIGQYIKENYKILEISQNKSELYDKFRDEGFNIESIDFENLVNLEIEDKYDLIYCIYGQLNHIENLTELAVIAKKAFSMLSPKGHLILQFFNSDKVLNDKNTLIKTTQFELTGRKGENDTLLNIKFEDNIKFELTPVLFTDIQTLSNKLGAYYVRFYGGFDNGKFFKPESTYLIAVISKPEIPIDMSKQASCSLI